MSARAVAARLRAELRRPEQRWRAAAFLVASLVLVAGKEAYRDASAAELRFFLAPTAELVSLASGADFAYESGTGWVSRDLMFIIAPACAGVNFALAAFLALSIGWLRAIRRGRDVAGRLLAAALAAYAATLAVNTARIAIAIGLRSGDVPTGGLSPEEIHRIEGVLVYLGGLCLLYRLARGRGPGSDMTADPPGGATHAATA